MIKYYFHNFPIQMSILQPENIEQIDLKNCKIEFLKSENIWLSGQFYDFSQVIPYYKEAILIGLSNQQCAKEKFKQKMKQLNDHLKKKVEESPLNKICQIANFQQQYELSLLTFMKLIASFEQLITKLRKDTLMSQKLLQDIEMKKPGNKIIENQLKQQKGTIQSIESYDIYPRLVEKYRKNIARLKMKKHQLQTQIINFKNLSKKQIESNCSTTVESQQSYKNVNRIQNSIDITSNKQQLTPFEQTVLVFKKKKYVNEKLRKRIEVLNKSIINKKQCIGKLQVCCQNSIWDNESLIFGGDGQYFFESNMNSISFMEKSSSKQLQFDVDFSKVITFKEKKKVRTYAQYKKQECP